MDEKEARGAFLAARWLAVSEIKMFIFACVRAKSVYFLLLQKMAV